MADEKGSQTSMISSPSRTSTTSSHSLQVEEKGVQVDEKKTPSKKVQPEAHIHPHHEHHRKNHHHDHHHHRGHHHRNHHHHHHRHHHRVSPVPPPPPHHNRPLVVGEDPKIDKPMHIDEWVEKTVEVASKSKSKEVKKEDRSKSFGGGLKGGFPHYHLEWQAIFRGRKMSSSSSSSGSQPISGLVGGGRRPKQLLYDVDSLPDMDKERRFPRSKSKTEVRPLVQSKPRDDERHGFTDDEAGSVYSWASSQSSSVVSASDMNQAEPLEEPPAPSETLIFHQNQKYSVGVEFRDLRFYGPWSGKVFLLLGTNHILTGLLALFMLSHYMGVGINQVDEALLWTTIIISILGYVGAWVVTWLYGVRWPRMVQLIPLLATWACTAGGSASIVVLLGVHSQFIPAFFALTGEAYLVLALCSFTATMEIIGWNLAIVATVSVGFFTLALLLTAALFGHFSIHILGASLPALGHTLLVVWELSEFVSGERLELRAHHIFLTATLLPVSAILNPPAVMIRRFHAKRHRHRTVPHIPKKK